MKSKPLCPMKHTKCFARTILGRCTALEDASYSGRPCPFFKPEEQLLQERTACLIALNVAELMDLLERYTLEKITKKAAKVVGTCV